MTHLTLSFDAEQSISLPFNRDTIGLTYLMSVALSGDPINAYSLHMSPHGTPMDANGIPAPQTPFTTPGLQFRSASEETAKKIANFAS